MSYISDGGGGGGVLPPAVPTTFRTTAGDAIPALNILTLTNGANITFSGAGSAITAALSGTTNHAIQLGNGTGSLSSLGVGATGTVLTGVTGADPAFSATPTVTTIYATTFDTNVAAAGVTLSGTTLSADGTDVDININITAKGTGKVIIDDLQLTTDLAVTEGGTGASTLLDHGLLVGSGTAAVDALAVGGTGVILTGVAGADPTWTSATYPSTVTKGDVLVASANNVVGVVNDVVNAGYVLTANAAAAPTFQVLPTPVVASFASDPETIAGAVTNKAVAPSNLAAKLGTQTLHALPIGVGSTNAIGWLAVGLNGQTLMGSTGADCGWTSSPQFGGSVTATNDINTTAGNLTASNGGLIVSNNAVSTADAQVEYRKTRTSGIITSGDGLGTMRFEGYDGVSFISGAKITSTNSGTVAVNRIAGDLKFYTHPDSVVALPSEPTLRMTIASTGATTIASPDAGVGLTVSGGGITCTSGAITASSGDVIITSGKLTLPITSSAVGNITLGGNVVFHTYGLNSDQWANLFIGRNAGNYTLSKGANIGSNIGIGALTFTALDAGQENFAMGYKSMNALTGKTNSGYRNVAVGNYSLYRLVGGNNTADNGAYNTCIGYNAGGYLTGNEYNNIFLNYAGVAGQTGRFQVGTSTASGAGAGKVDTAWICGIYGRTPAGTQNIALIDSNNQLGSVATLPPSLGGAMTWTEVTGTSQAAAVNNGYIASNVALVTVTLPASAAVGERIAITGKGAGLWSLAQNAGQTVHFGSFDTTPGVGGSITASVRYDCIEVQCTTANTDWVVRSSQGALVIV